MTYQLKIGTVSYQSEVDGTDEWSQTVVRDFREKLLRVRGNYTFSAWKALYDVLYTDTVANGVCSSLTGKIYFKPCNGDYEQVWEGQLKAQDGEYDLIKGSVDHQVLDNSWSAQFNNSKDQKVFLKGTTSKNGTAIKQVDFNSCQFFDPTDSTESNYLADRRKCYPVMDVLRYLIDYYSNGEVSFVSDFYDSGGEGDQYYITTGKELRLHEGDAEIELSFSEAFTELDKKHNLWIIVEGTFDNPVIRIEQYGYAFDEDISVEVQNPEQILMKADLDNLYTIVDIGSDATEYDTSNNANYINLYTKAWNEESYNNAGDCEFENNTLDLVSDWKIDSNSIEQAVMNATDDHDDKIFLIEIDPTAPDYDAFKFEDTITQASTIAYYYNHNLQNPQVLDNWKGLINNVKGKGLGTEYYVYVDTPTVTTFSTEFVFMRFTNDSTGQAEDTANIYTTISEDPAHEGEFKAPESGVYNFIGNAKIATGRPISLPVSLRMEVVVWEDDTLTTPLQVYRTPLENAYGTYTISMVFDVEMNVGNVAKVRPRTPGYLLSKTLEAGVCIVTKVGEFIYQATDNPLSYLYDIQKFQLSQADFDTVTANKEKRIRFKDTKTGREWKLWPKEMTYSHRLGEVITGEFIGYAPENPLCWVLDGEFDRGFWDDLCYWVDQYGWVDCSSTVVSNPDITGNPVGTWSLLLGTTQTGERTFTDPAGGPVYDVYLRQTIELPAGTYTLYSSASISAVDTTWGGEFTLTGASGLGSLWTSTDLSETTATTFTVTGSSTRTFTARFAANIGASPTYTINQINIC